MLFNSFVFLLAFLPFSLAAHWLAERFRPEWRLPLLLVLSFIFYSYWTGASRRCWRRPSC